MKKLITLSLLLIFIFSIAEAQKSGLIKYKETVKLDLDIDAPEGMDLSGMLPESVTTHRDLFFSGKESVYKDGAKNESHDMEMESDDGSIQIVLKMDDTEEIFYTDVASSTALRQTGFMGKDFIISEPFKKDKWKLTGEKVMYLGYECHKATTSRETGEEENPVQEIVAWFAPQISAPVGPMFYNQLPGAILMLSVDGDRIEIMATEIDLEKDVSKQLKQPDKGKKLTNAEFDKLVAEKEAEMKEMHGGRRMMIRN